MKEGGSSVRACTNPSADAVEFCIQPRKSYKRGIAQDESTKVKKIPKLQATHLASIYTEAWNLLHAPGKLRDTEAGSSGDIADGMVNTPSVPATTDRSFHIVQQLLDEYGVEKAEDLGHLDNVYLIKIAGYLKVVPRKIFLEMLGVPVPPATGTV